MGIFPDSETASKYLQYKKSNWVPLAWDRFLSPAEVAISSSKNGFATAGPLTPSTFTGLVAPGLRSPIANAPQAGRRAGFFGWARASSSSCLPSVVVGNGGFGSREDGWSTSSMRMEMAVDTDRVLDLEARS